MLTEIKAAVARSSLRLQRGQPPPRLAAPPLLPLHLRLQLAELEAADGAALRQVRRPRLGLHGGRGAGRSRGG